MGKETLSDGDLPRAPSNAKVYDRKVAVPGGSVFCRRYDTGATGAPLIALHGGPGFPSYYLEPLSALAIERPVILFDQLGCGRSDRPDDARLWTLDRFAGELDSILEDFGYPRYHLYGHSWGSMVITHYATAIGTEKVMSLIESSPALNINWWEEDCKTLIKEMGDKHRNAIKRANASGDFSGSDYEAASSAFYLRHVCKRGMQTELFQKTIAEAGYPVYNHIQGPNEFTVTGAMKGWDFTPRLAEIGVSVLYLTGAEDEARPNTVARFATLTPGSRMVVIPDAAHLTMLDNAAAANRAISMFMAEVDGQQP